MIERIQATSPTQPLFGRLPQHAGKEMISYLKDLVSLSKPDRPTSMQLVQQLVERHLADEFPLIEVPKNGASKNSEEHVASSPSGVAGTIFEHIRQGLSNSVSKASSALTETQFEQFSAEVLKGVDRGLSEAREVLESMHVLEGEIESDVEQTGKLLVERLELWVEITRIELFGETSADED